MNNSNPDILNLAVNAHKNGNLKEAENYYFSILKEQPFHPDANHNLGILFVNLGKIKKSLTFFKKALKANDRIDQFWVSYIDALVKMKRYKEAHENFRKAKLKGLNNDTIVKIKNKISTSPLPRVITHEPPNNQLQSLIDQFNLKNYQFVIDEALIILKSFPRSSSTLNIIGAGYSKLKDNKKALIYFDQALKLNPNFSSALCNKGNALGSIGDVDSAIDCYKHCILLDNKFYEAYNNLGNYLRLKNDYDNALFNLNKAIELNPKYSLAFNNLGLLYRSLNNYDKSEKCYLQALDLNPNYCGALNNLGALMQDKKKYDQAEKFFFRALNIDTNYIEALVNLGNLYREINNFGKAKEYYKKALLIDSNHEIANHQFASLSGVNIKSSPKSYIKSLFDKYSNNFEDSLIKELEYNVPTLLSNELHKLNIFSNKNKILDLGCGTGLFADSIPTNFYNLTGVDLSNQMLDQARKKNKYHTLKCVDIVEFLKVENLNYDLIVATDVFIYLGDLTDIFNLIKTRNLSSSFLAFSTEHLEDGTYKFLPSCRFAHSKDYILSLCMKFKFQIIHFSTCKLRKEQGNYLPGALYILKS